MVQDGDSVCLTDSGRALTQLVILALSSPVVRRLGDLDGKVVAPRWKAGTNQRGACRPGVGLPHNWDAERHRANAAALRPMRVTVVIGHKEDGEGLASLTPLLVHEPGQARNRIRR